MIDSIVEWLELQYNIPPVRSQKIIQRTVLGGSALAFVVIATITLAFDDIFTRTNPLTTIRVGDIAPFDVVAPQSTQFISDVLTTEAQQSARNTIQPIYDPPDPNVARQQTELLENILRYIDQVRQDPYGTQLQKINDINAITALTLDESVILNVLGLSNQSWENVSNEAVSVLGLAMRESIRNTTIDVVREQLSNQVSIRFNEQEISGIVAIVEDIIRPNTFENTANTEQARTEASNAVLPVTRSFMRGELVVGGGQVITPAMFEALQNLGLLTPSQLQPQDIVTAFTLTTMVMVMMGLFIIHFDPIMIYQRVRLFAMLCAIFLLMLIATRVLGVNGNIFLFPTASLGLLFVAIAGHHVAIIGMVGMSIFVGYMSNGSLEITALVMMGSVIGTLTLQRTERLNTFFLSGAIIGLVNAAIVAIFEFGAPVVNTNVEILGRVVVTFVSGAILVPATAIAAMYLVTQIFNLPTALRLIELSQPNKPLLQRLLREAPGTYQHSLQVANLAEQAVARIGGDTLLTSVAALYHDIGKMENPLFFTENLADPALNPHESLNDPYRSASIILEHVTGGNELAKQNHLPHRIRDFIMEHHGTTTVYVFYQRALALADSDATQVDISAFTYPGPKPRSRETAILMLADSCEATVRSKKPQSRQEIVDAVDMIFDGKRKAGQLDESNLTLTELQMVRESFINVLQGMFHPRINYQEAALKKPTPISSTKTTPMPKVESTAADYLDTGDMKIVQPIRRSVEVPSVKVPKPDINSKIGASSDDEPMEVPRLPRVDGMKPTNGKAPEHKDEEQIE
jgi:cyclic-di-AMP phosphodiesterase PgpH